MAEDRSSPKNKRMKLESSEAATTASAKERKAFPRPILADEYTREIETIQMLVSPVTDRKQCSRLIRKLNDEYPLKELGHLKRIKNVKNEGGETLLILLCLVGEHLSPLLDLKIILNGFKADGLGDPFPFNVPKHQPLTRQQFDKSSKLWPTFFREDKYISKMVNGELFTEEDKQKIDSFMSIAIDAARHGKKQGMVADGAVVVDPADGHIVAVAHDLSKKGHPLQHAIMVVIDLVARSQQGGAWELSCCFSNNVWALSDEHSSCVKPNSFCNNCVKPLRSGELKRRDTPSCDVNIASDYTARTFGEVTTVGEDILSRKTHNDYNISGWLNGLQNLSKQDASEETKQGAYLCTGYDVYVTREPCVMCSMALVHSRVRRVFYGCANPAVGALGSRYKIHTRSGLNHHFEVFTGILENECEKLTDET